MTGHELIDLLATRGITLRVEAGQLRYKAPEGSLTPALLGFTKAHRDELIDILTSKPINAESCPKCGGPIHDAAEHHPGIVVLLCDDNVACRWGYAMARKQYAELLKERAN